MQNTNLTFVYVKQKLDMPGIVLRSSLIPAQKAKYSFFMKFERKSAVPQRTICFSRNFNCHKQYTKQIITNQLICNVYVEVTNIDDTLELSSC